MYDRVLKRARRLIRALSYVMSAHADEEMNADGLAIGDVENVILTGEIRERQKDRATGELKYVVTGRSLADAEVSVVVKVGPTGKLVLITVFLA
jgi:uncharacterized protein DUF4258